MILDADTKTPLARVSMVNYQKEEAKQYSDSVGHFEFRSVSGGLWGCPDVEITFSKEGYKPLKQTFNSYSQNDSIYLEKIE